MTTQHNSPLGGTRGVFLRWSPDDCIKAADYTLTRLHSFGVHVQAPNRLERARDLVRQSNRFDVQYDPASRTTEIAVAEAQKSIFEMFFIVKDLQPPDVPTRKKLASILNAPDIPARTGDDPGRDNQAELLTGAVMRAVGFHVDVDEPDLVIFTGTTRWGVAVKRPKSDSQYKKRVRKAQRQLVAHNLYGFVVVNPEIFLAEAYLNSPDDDLSAILFQKIDDWVGYLDQNSTIDRVLAVIALGTSFRLVRSNAGQIFVFGIHIHPRFVTSGDPAELKDIESLAQDMATNLKVALGSIRVPDVDATSA